MTSPSLAELAALDEYLDAVAAGAVGAPSPLLDAELAAAVDRLASLPASAWGGFEPPEGLADRLIEAVFASPQSQGGAVVSDGVFRRHLRPARKLISRRRHLQPHRLARRSPSSSVPRSSKTLGSGHFRRRGQGAVLAALVAVAGVLTLVNLVTGSSHGPGSGSPGPWSLAGSIDAPGFSVSSPAGFAGEGLVCASTTTCLAWSASPGGSVVRSVDGGGSWTSVAVPAGVQFTSGSSFSCPAAEVCYAAGEQGSGATGRAVVLQSVDGGATWASRPVPAQLSTVGGIACPTVTECAAFGASFPPLTGAAATPVAVATADGGATWSVYPLPASLVVEQIDCSSTTSCVIVGFEGGSGTYEGAAMISSDGGRSWQAASLPPGMGSLEAVSCAPDGWCAALAQPSNTQSPASNASIEGGPSSPSVVIESDDGGASWTSSPDNGLPVALLRSVACPSKGSCVAAGRILNASSPSLQVPSGVLVATSDGSSWSVVPLDLGPSSPEPLSWVGAISCPAAGSCLALAQSTSGGQALVLRGAP